MVADEPEVGAACTTALLGGGADPAVRAARDRIGAEIHRRITSAIGPGADPSTVSALEMAFFGALVQAGSGDFTYHQIADRLAYVVGLILAGAGETSRHRKQVTHDRSWRPELVLDPYDYDFHEDPYPYYRRLRDEAPLYRNEELGFWALSRHRDVQQGFRNSTTLSNRDGVSLDPVSRGPHAEDDVVSGDGRPGASSTAHAGVKRLHAAADSRARAARHRDRRAAPRRHAGEGRARKASTTSRNSPASCRWT